MRKIIFVPTWRCNLKCPYCDYRTEKNTGEGYKLLCFGKEWLIERECTWQDWARKFERFAPFHLELTGGEPTIFPGLPKLLAHLPVGCTWGLTSNTLQNPSDYPAHNCKGWTASWHDVNKEKFLQNIATLRSKGINTRVTVVITPENIRRTIEAIIEFVKAGIGVNVHHVLSQGFDWEEYPDELEMIRNLDSGNGKVSYISTIATRWEPKHFPMCNAGGDYFMVLPDGKVLPCYSALLWDGGVGHIDLYTPDDSYKPCGRDCIFDCDRTARKLTT